MDFAFVLDPLPLLKAYKDTSIAMMRAVAARGHRIYAIEQPSLYWRDGATRAPIVWFVHPGFMKPVPATARLTVRQPSVRPTIAGHPRRPIPAPFHPVV